MLGNVPRLADERLIAGLLMGGALLLLALLLSARIERARTRGSWSRRTAWLARVALFLGFFVAWEIALQAAPRSTSEFAPDPLAFWKASPDLYWEMRRTHPQLYGDLGESGRFSPYQGGSEGLASELGIFDAQYPVEKPAGTWRVVVMGDSQSISTAGRQYGGHHTYAKRLDEAGLQGPRGQPLQVINAGMSGYSSWQGLLLLRSAVLELRPDVLVEAFGYHDSNLAFSPDREVLTDDPRVHALRTVLYRSRIYLLLRTLVLRRQAARNDSLGADASSARVPPEDYERNLRALVAMGEAEGFRVVFFVEPLRDPEEWGRSARHRDVARRLGGELGVPVVDAFSVFEAMPPERRAALFEDNIHLTPEGHELLGRLLLDVLLKAGLVRREESWRGPASDPGPAEFGGGPLASQDSPAFQEGREVVADLADARAREVDPIQEEFRP